MLGRRELSTLRSGLNFSLASEPQVCAKKGKAPGSRRGRREGGKTMVDGPREAACSLAVLETTHPGANTSAWVHTLHPFPQVGNTHGQQPPAMKDREGSSGAWVRTEGGERGRMREKQNLGASKSPAGQTPKPMSLSTIPYNVGLFFPQGVHTTFHKL